MHMDDSAFKATQRKTIKYLMCITKAKPGLWSWLGGKGAGKNKEGQRDYRISGVRPGKESKLE